MLNADYAKFFCLEHKLDRIQWFEIAETLKMKDVQILSRVILCIELTKLPT